MAATMFAGHHQHQTRNHIKAGHTFQCLGLMNNSFHSVTTDTQTGTTTLRLHLHDYLTPSLNTILSSHWSNLHKHKQNAKTALLSALKELPQNSKTLITSWAEQNLSPTNFATLVSSLMTTQLPSSPTTHNKSANTKRTRKPSSKSPTNHSHHPPAQPHKH